MLDACEWNEWVSEMNRLRHMPNQNHRIRSSLFSVYQTTDPTTFFSLLNCIHLHGIVFISLSTRFAPREEKVVAMRRVMLLFSKCAKKIAYCDQFISLNRIHCPGLDRNCPSAFFTNLGNSMHYPTITGEVGPDRIFVCVGSLWYVLTYKWINYSRRTENYSALSIHGCRIRLILFRNVINLHAIWIWLVAAGAECFFSSSLIKLLKLYTNQL